MSRNFMQHFDKLMNEYKSSDDETYTLNDDSEEEEQETYQHGDVDPAIVLMFRRADRMNQHHEEQDWGDIEQIKDPTPAKVIMFHMKHIEEVVKQIKIWYAFSDALLAPERGMILDKVDNMLWHINWMKQFVKVARQSELREEQEKWFDEQWKIIEKARNEL